MPSLAEVPLDLISQTGISGAHAESKSVLSRL